MPPIYDTYCPKCEATWEALCKYEDRPECPKCGDPRSIRIASIQTKAPHVTGAGKQKVLNRASNPPTDPVSVYIKR